MPSPAHCLGGRLARPAALRLAALAASLALAPALSAVTVDFGDVNLATPPAQSGPGGVFYNGSAGVGGIGDWSSGGVGFNNNYTDFGGGFSSWDGFAYSTTTDNTTAGFGNQYSSFAGGGAGGSGAYAVAFAGYVEPATITFAGVGAPISVDVTNTTYTALDMAAGSGFSKKFGGVSGDDADFLAVTFTGFDATHAQTGKVTFYLADFRFKNNALDYIVDEWTTVDLTGLGIDVATIELSFASSDTGAFGINTPTYLALDNLIYASAIPEPATTAALAGVGLLGFAALRRRRA
ncbi:MAG: DUF4465 domain-containing protein [Burkholderiales bacterium]|nr:DUF4465 domain-containing protein [Opitutaceae bacterium]